jgi:putative ABC transport system ATP-binding protein
VLDEGVDGGIHTARSPKTEEPTSQKTRRIIARIESRLAQTPNLSDTRRPVPDPQTAPASPATHDPRLPVFAARGLRKVYHTGEVDVVALHGVDLDFYSGELVCLLGASGSGKSTLLNILGGLDVPTTGDLRYRGWDLTDAAEKTLTLFRRNCVGFVFQFYNLIPSLTARENVALITEISRDPMKPEDALEMVGLSARMDHFPSQLSGGEQQRVAIARAIAKRPEVLLCDEPTGALDVTTGIAVLEAVERINRELGTLTVIITHNAAMAEMADRVLHLKDGQIIRAHKNETRLPVRSLQW